jgi:hypothetical protein
MARVLQSCCSFDHFLLTIVLSVLLRFTNSDYSYCIFKLFLSIYYNGNNKLVPHVKNKQRSTKHSHKTKDRVTRTPLKTGVELKCSGKACSSLRLIRFNGN